MRSLFIIISLFSLLHIQVEAQYWGERALEKSFEQSNLFYNPFFLNPYGIRAFRDIPAGFIDDPINNLNMNPASLPDPDVLPRHIYVDFRGDRHQPDVIHHYWGIRTFNWATSQTASAWFIDPRWFSQAREEPEPFFSAAIMGYPSPNRLSNLFIGLNYQLIYTDERYYHVPADIYRSQFGLAADGRLASGMENVPIIDRLDGSDHMNHQGHFLSGFLGLRLSDNFTIGFRGGFVTIARDGSQGQLRVFDDYFSPGRISQWRNWNDRTQDYMHVDLSGGINILVSENTRIGVTIGWLSGDADQALDRTRFSLYADGEQGTDDRWYYNRLEAEAIQRWDQEGNTWYGSLDATFRLAENQSFILNLSTLTSDIDLRNSSSIMDTAYYASRWTHPDGAWTEHQTISYVIDERTGSGTRDLLTIRTMAAYHWRLDERTRVEFGISGMRHRTNIGTRETVYSERLRDSESVGHWERSYFYFKEEDKDLVWDFSSRRLDLSIPLVIHRELSNILDLTLGINRRLRAWTIDDETIAYVRYREHIENDTYRFDQNFGERFREPRERISESTTSGIIGLTVNLTEQFGIRTLLEPNINDLPKITQWWLAFRMNP